MCWESHHQSRQFSKAARYRTSKLFPIIWSLASEVCCHVLPCLANRKDMERQIQSVGLRDGTRLVQRSLDCMVASSSFSQQRWPELFLITKKWLTCDDMWRNVTKLDRISFPLAEGASWASWASALGTKYTKCTHLFRHSAVARLHFQIVRSAAPNYAMRGDMLILERPENPGTWTWETLEDLWPHSLEVDESEWGWSGEGYHQAGHVAFMLPPSQCRVLQVHNQNRQTMPEMIRNVPSGQNLRIY